jgi:ABC-2 type transport system permease protein
VSKIKFIALKEVRHILRDPRSLVIAMLMPILMTLLYGYAINLDVKNIKLAVMDYDMTSDSRDLANRFYNSGYFLLPMAAAQMDDPERVLKRGDANAVLIIKPGFSEALMKQSTYQLGLLVDGADANYAAAAANYSSILLGRFLEERMPLGMKIPGVILSQRVLYNPDLKSSHFFVPGLIAVILMMISALLTSITIAREKETGTMEQLLTTPVTPAQVILGKVIPYVGIALLDGCLIILFAVFQFGVPFEGSIALLAFFGVIYVIAALSIGILISTLVNTQQVAMMAALLVTVLPSVMLSGFIFEIKNMPGVLQWITYIIPAKYFLLIIRGIMLKGAGIAILWKHIIFLILLTAGLLGSASKRFKLKMG